MSDETLSPEPLRPPEFSVLISLYQAERAEFLDQCLQSVAEQSWLATEIVLVLDGPVGETLTAVIDAWRERLPLKVLPLAQRGGLGPALAHGLTHCSHEIVVRADTDDFSQPWRFERQVGFLDHNPQFDICGSCVFEVDPETLQPQGRRVVPETDTTIAGMLPYRCPFNHPSVVLRRSAVLAAGNYADFPFAEDYDLWLRMLAAGSRGWNLQDDLVLARTGADHLRRRRGLGYVGTEYRLYRLKRRLRVSGPVMAAAVFGARALMRLLPAALLKPVYRALRRS